MTTGRSSLLVPVLVALAVFVAPMQQANAVIEDGPTAANRQQLVYELNLARWNPVAYGNQAGSDQTGTVARPPLALSDQLAESAQFKADEMAVFGYFAYQSQATGLWANQLARDTGYPLGEIFGVETNNIESLHSGSPVVFDVLTSFANSPTHQRHLFGQSWFETHREVGVGRSATQNYWAVHTAVRPNTQPRVTGVVYTDINGNGRMDLGEGLTGVAVRIGNRTVITQPGGGYTAEMGVGIYPIAALGENGNFTGISGTEIQVGTHNVGVDFISGNPTPTVRAYQTCQGLEPTILGTSGNDILTGTPGRDIIYGLGGNDTIDGLGGDDIICHGDTQPPITIEELSFKFFSLGAAALEA